MRPGRGIGGLIPGRVRTLLASVYRDLGDRYERQRRRLHPRERPDDRLHSEFVADAFDSRSEYRGYVEELEEGPIADVRDEALDEYRRLTGDDSMGAIGLDTARDYYAVTRALEPEVAVETGVCNGLSTVSILLALRTNGTGHLYSVDYPLRADEPLDEFRRETFEGYGGAAIPSDREPGWIVPEELRRRWDLTIGKSQRELPRLVTDLGGLDLFVHDSEHSLPCMMFEYELAYEWLTDGGVLLSDDITWNDAFDVFTEVREPAYGRLSKNVGYVRK